MLLCYMENQSQNGVLDGLVNRLGEQIDAQIKKSQLQSQYLQKADKQIQDYIKELRSIKDNLKHQQRFCVSE